MIPRGTPLGGVQVALAGAPVIGQVDDAGRLINLGQLTGWWDSAATSGTSTQRVNDHGVFIGPAFYGSRIIGVEARIDGLNPGDSMATAERLIEAVSLDALGLITVTDENRTLSALVRQEGDPLLARSGNRVTVSLSLLAPDPRRYGEIQFASVPLVADTQNIVHAVNDGNIASCPLFVIDGECQVDSLFDDLGRQLSYPDVDVPVSESLVVDTDLRTALLDGEFAVVVGTWPRLEPGSNVFSLNTLDCSPGSLLTVAYRSAWK